MCKAVKEVSFTEATPLLAFIERNRDKIVGQTFRNLYMCHAAGNMSDQPLTIELDDYVLVIYYFVYSDITIQVFDREVFFEEDTQETLDEYIPRGRPYEYTPIAGLGQKIVDIKVGRFSEEFQYVAGSGATRPAGGDYFMTFVVYLDNGERFFFCGLDGASDGYVEVWDDTDPPLWRQYIREQNHRSRAKKRPNV